MDPKLGNGTAATLRPPAPSSPPSVAPRPSAVGSEPITINNPRSSHMAEALKPQPQHEVVSKADFDAYVAHYKQVVQKWQEHCRALEDRQRDVDETRATLIHEESARMKQLSDRNTVLEHRLSQRRYNAIATFVTGVMFAVAVVVLIQLWNSIVPRLSAPAQPQVIYLPTPMPPPAATLPAPTPPAPPTP